MTLTYVFHSGFMLEGTDAILIFDFWRDAANGVVEQTLRTTRKRAYFLASHFHPDHFNPEILRMEVPCGEKRVMHPGFTRSTPPSSPTNASCVCPNSAMSHMCSFAAAARRAVPLFTL